MTLLKFFIHYLNKILSLLMSTNLKNLWLICNVNTLAFGIARELEQYVMHKKPAPSYPSTYARTSTSASNPSSPPTSVGSGQKFEVVQPDKLPNFATKDKEPNSCWKCGDSWTPKHIMKCKFCQQSAHAMERQQGDILCGDHQLD